jgi:hypothetical protein
MNSFLGTWLKSSLAKIEAGERRFGMVGSRPEVWACCSWSVEGRRRSFLRGEYPKSSEMSCFETKLIGVTKPGVAIGEVLPSLDCCSPMLDLMGLSLRVVARMEKVLECDNIIADNVEFGHEVRVVVQLDYFMSGVGGTGTVCGGRN